MVPKRRLMLCGALALALLAAQLAGGVHLLASHEVHDECPHAEASTHLDACTADHHDHDCTLCRHLASGTDVPVRPSSEIATPTFSAMPPAAGPLFADLVLVIFSPRGPPSLRS